MAERQWKTWGKYQDQVYRCKHLAVRLGGGALRDQIAKVVYEEYERVQDEDLSEETLRKTLRLRVKRRIRNEHIGFVWWLPIVLWAAEVLIELIIKIWIERRKPE
jgi:hypothetical protein